MELYQKLELLRKEKGEKENRKLTQEIAAQEMGLSVSALRNYEGSRLPRLEELRKIKIYYDVPYEYLCNDLCENKIPGNLSAGTFFGLSDTTIQMLREQYLKKEKTSRWGEHPGDIDVISTINLLCEYGGATFFEDIGIFIEKPNIDNKHFSKKDKENIFKLREGIVLLDLDEWLKEDIMRDIDYFVLSKQMEAVFLKIKNSKTTIDNLKEKVKNMREYRRHHYEPEKKKEPICFNKSIETANKSMGFE